MNAQHGQAGPLLTARQELAMLMRLLVREGYNEHVAGHISYVQPDGQDGCTRSFVGYARAPGTAVGPLGPRLGKDPRAKPVQKAQQNPGGCSASDPSYGIDSSNQLPQNA